MKKQTNLPAGVWKLSLNKKTISNLNSSEMNRVIGGASQTYCGPTFVTHCGRTRNCTQNQNTCAGHNTCQYTCI